VLISDQTPWKNLAIQKAGWDISLSDQQSIISTLNNALAMNDDEMTTWCKKAWKYCNEYILKAGIKEQYLNLFR
jgi:hypothetical protein